jgi:hypothetical protein
MKVNDQGKQTSTTDTFAPFTTQAIRMQYTGTKEHNSRIPYFRVAEIIARDAAGNTIEPAGARTNDYFSNWRSTTWAPQVYDGELAMRKGSGVHFNKYVTVWFDRDVTIASLEVAMPIAPRSDWAWVAYKSGETYTDTGSRF